jgi:hypothetical protein
MMTMMTATSEAFVDASWICVHVGEVRRICYSFVMTLYPEGELFVRLAPEDSCSALFEGHEAAFRVFWCVPPTIRYHYSTESPWFLRILREPRETIMARLQDYALARSFRAVVVPHERETTPSPAANLLSEVYHNAMVGHWRSLDQLNRTIETWCRYGIPPRY